MEFMEGHGEKHCTRAPGGKSLDLAAACGGRVIEKRTRE